MSKPYLKTSLVSINGVEVSIRQISGLERFDFLDYTSTLVYPELLPEPDENAPQEERDEYVTTTYRHMREVAKTTFFGQSRLVAYGMVSNDSAALPIDERHQLVMNSFTKEDIKLLHDEIAKLSGMSLPDEEQTDASSEPQSVEKETSPNPKA